MGINAVSFRGNTCLTENTDDMTKNTNSESIFSEKSDTSKLTNTCALITGIGVGIVTGIMVFKHRKNIKGVKEFNSSLKKKLANSKTIKIEATVDDFWGNVKQQQPAVRKFCEAKKAGYNLTEAETTYCKEIINEFDSIYPNERLAYAYADMVQETKQHINGDVTVITRDVDRHLNYMPSPRLELKTSSNQRLNIREDSIRGDENLVSEYKAFIGDGYSGETLFQEFVTHRSMNHVKENGLLFSDLNEMRTSKAKGEVVKKAEEAYHKERDYMYSQLWRPYPTQQFYRVIGEEELTKLLRGEIIISKNSKARYGRWCVDITPSQYYHDIYYGEPKFRISFKRKNAEGRWNTDFTSKIYEFRPEKSHYQIPSYSYKDVNLNDIRYWDGSDWQLVQFD